MALDLAELDATIRAAATHPHDGRPIEDILTNAARRMRLGEPLEDALRRAADPRAASPLWKGDDVAYGGGVDLVPAVPGMDDEALRVRHASDRPLQYLTGRELTDLRLLGDGWPKLAFLAVLEIAARHA